MASVCKSDCVEDARVPMRLTYANLYKWPESDAEFVKSISSKENRGPGPHAHSRVVDGISCRQMYLRSYTFSRQKSSMPEKTKKCLGRILQRVAMADRIRRGQGKENGNTRRVATADSTRRDQGKENSTSTAVRKRRFGLIRTPAMEGRSSGTLSSFFRRLLFCTAKVDAVDHGDT
ncbi:uncharacterized protein LOC121240089 [Juglans microcarpa x Juglans regia]|uniref:uncharacterized protein LOC121240089 n=1 Tax=Juglans microcarpa x Juglans regia TaxID=2249226 RepID=UPI001B7F2B9D|nr:uncharacterized protein LOC121240089 [Juglans microcarpa x Juglans regia]